MHAKPQNMAREELSSPITAAASSIRHLRPAKFCLTWSKLLPILVRSMSMVEFDEGAMCSRQLRSEHGRCWWADQFCGGCPSMEREAPCTSSRSCGGKWLK